MARGSAFTARGIAETWRMLSTVAFRLGQGRPAEGCAFLVVG